MMRTKAIIFPEPFRLRSKLRIHNSQYSTAKTKGFRYSRNKNSCACKHTETKMEKLGFVEVKLFMDCSNDGSAILLLHNKADVEFGAALCDHADAIPILATMLKISTPHPAYLHVSTHNRDNCNVIFGCDSLTMPPLSAMRFRYCLRLCPALSVSLSWICYSDAAAEIMTFMLFLPHQRPLHSHPAHPPCQRYDV